MRLRLTFSKKSWLVYSSHLDLMRVWERALRRAGAALAYSGGYNPRPKLQLARALPLGHSGERELIDVWLEDRAPLQAFSEALLPVLPEGLKIKEVRQVDPGAPAMQTQVVATEYRVTVDWDETQEATDARIQRTMAQEEIRHQRRGKRYNLRPLIEALWLDAATGREVVLGMRLSARPRATGRPEAVLDVLGMGNAFARYRRTEVILESPG